jgi:iron complex outermembrane receptor protein
MKMIRTRRTTVARVVSAVLAGCAGLASGVPASAETASLEEVMVTATRHGETDLQRTPIAVTAISSDELSRFVGRDISAISADVPNFSASRITAFNAASFAIRGVGLTDIIVYLDSPVAVNIDDFVTPSVQTQLLDTFDIERVEVLRGPQGTLFGKNTTGGLVNVTTKQPRLGESDAEFRAMAGSFGRYQLQGALNLPAGDSFAARAVVSYNKSDGFYENGATYGPTTGIPGLSLPEVLGLSGRGRGEDVGGDDSVNGRLKGLWQPNDAVSLLVQYEFVRDRSDAVPSFNDTPKEPGCDPFGLGITSGDPCKFVWNSIGVTQPSGDPIENAATTNRNDGFMATRRGQEIDVDGFYANLDWDVGFATAHVVAGYREQESRLPNTYTGAVPVKTNGDEISLFDASRDDDRETTQVEIRLAGNDEETLDWVVGAFWQQNDATFCVAQMLGINEWFGAPGANDTPSILCNAQDAMSYAGFGDLTWQVSDKLQLGAGARWTYEEREWIGRPQGSVAAITGDPNLTWEDFSEPLSLANFGRSDWAGNGECRDNPGNPGTLIGVCREEEDWSEPTYSARVAYQFTDDLGAYFRYDRGFKSGGYNDQTGTQGFFVPALLEAYDPEFADSFEVGFKSTFLDNRLRFNAAAFLAEYSDAQRSVVASVCIPTAGGPITCPDGQAGRPFQATAFFNAADVSVKGLELEGTALIVDGLIIRANLSYNDGEYDKFETDTNGDGVNDLDLSGLTLTRTPEWKWGINTLYTHDALGGRMDWNVVVSYEDENVFYYADRNQGLGSEFDSFLDEKTLLDASVTYTGGEGRWFVRAFGNNLTDERYRVASQVVSNLWTHSQFGAPRNYGVQVGMNFGW